MDYREFRSAAHRHLVSCQKMCDALPNIKDLTEKNSLMADIYYLSGYVIESLLSYAIFHSSDRKVRNKPVEEHPDYENGFKTHNFQAKISFAIKHSCNLNGICFISQKHPNEDFMKLFNNWRVEWRYQSPVIASSFTNISETLIQGYVNSLKEVERQFNSRFI